MPRTGPVLSHWHTLIDDFSTSGQDFYQAVEAAVEAREVPKVSFSRVTYREGGLMSAKREYLRIARKGVAFDLCAAPYGTSFFFSWWLVQRGPKHPVLYLLLFLLLILTPPALAYLFAPYDENIFVTTTFLSLVIVPLGLAALAREGVFGPEEHIVAIPIIGWLYDKLFHPNTYYALDTALMFQESIRRSVNETIEGTLSGQGLRGLSEGELRPTMRELTR